MAENNKKNTLEQFFRVKTGEYDIPFREEDWLKLEQKLIIRDQQIAYRKKILWLAAASFLIISLLGYFTYDNYHNINELNRQLSDGITPPMGQEQSFDPSLGMGLIDPEPDDPDELTGEKTEERTPTLTDLAAQFPETEGEDTKEYAVSGMLTSEDIAEPTITGTEFLAEGLTVPVKEYYLTSDAGASRLNTHLASPVSMDIQSSSIPGQTEGFYEGGRSGPLTIGLAVTPDLSTVGSLSNFHNPGYKFGLTIEFELSKNLSVSTGILNTMVRYTALNTGYNTPDYWNLGITPGEVIGECLLLDIPIGIKYSFLNFDRSRFFATAGLSSYIMMDEEYLFKYEGYDTELEGGWSGKTGTRHWMSNAGFSIGYELDFHRNWSVRAEPYIKIPVKEVGWANVRLYSLGSFVSIHYRI